MKFFIPIFILFVFGSSFSSCATVARGTHDNMALSTEPIAAKVTTDRETLDSIKARKKSPEMEPIFYGCASTPCEFKVPRKSEFILTIEKEGFETVEIGVDNGIHKESMNANLAGSAGVGLATGVGLGAAVGAISGVGTGTAVGAGAATTAIVALPILATSLIVDSSSGALLNLRPNPIAIVLPPKGTIFEPHPKVRAIREKRAAEAEKKAKRKSQNKS